jgi:hypothetical protein
MFVDRLSGNSIISSLSGGLDEAQKIDHSGARLDPDLRLSNLKDRIGAFRPGGPRQVRRGLAIGGVAGVTDVLRKTA